MRPRMNYRDTNREWNEKGATLGKKDEGQPLT